MAHADCGEEKGDYSAPDLPQSPFLPQSFRAWSPTDVVRHPGKDPHTHGVTLSPDNHFAFACDMGLDRLMAYRYDAAKGKLTPAAVTGIQSICTAQIVIPIGPNSSMLTISINATPPLSLPE